MSYIVKDTDGNVELSIRIDDIPSYVKQNPDSPHAKGMMRVYEIEQERIEYERQQSEQVL